jgi:hypothetical protein
MVGDEMNGRGVASCGGCASTGMEFKAAASQKVQTKKIRRGEAAYICSFEVSALQPESQIRLHSWVWFGGASAVIVIHLN